MLDLTGLNKEYERLYKPGETPEEAFTRLVEVLALLRKLCPWDSVQTHESLRRYMIEEAYEAVDAINREDFDNLKEELGDVMLQTVLHAEIASEENRFNIIDVMNDECDKMIRRHPHIFSTETAKTVDKVLEKWENVKVKEHGDVTITQRLLDVPKALPALTRSEKVQKRAADVGFDWPDIQGAVDKIQEEYQEFIEAHKAGDFQASEEELGDLLFSVVNAARFAGIDPEEALSKASDKFVKRFALLEESAVREGRDLREMTLAEMDELWEKVKK